MNKLSFLRNAAQENDEELVRSALYSIVPTFTTPEEFNEKVQVKV